MKKLQTKSGEDLELTSPNSSETEKVCQCLNSATSPSLPPMWTWEQSEPLTLQGTTNPDKRDQQNRTPVFIVGKDFVSAVALRSGLTSSYGGQVRPYDVKGSSGIIPKVKINYFEVGQFCSQSKDLARNACEQVFRFLSDKVRKGEPCLMEIPQVGQFIVRSNVAAVSFRDDVLQETKGKTAKGHYVNKLFASSVMKSNMKINDGTDRADKSLRPEVVQTGGAMKMTGGAESWLSKNLNINFEDINKPSSAYGSRTMSAQGRPQSQYGNLNRYSSMKPQDLRASKAWAQPNGGEYGNGSTLTQDNKDQFDRMSGVALTNTKRPMSAYSRASGSSRLTALPEVSRMKLQIIAGDIFKNRQVLTEVLQNMKKSLRNTMTSSEMQSVLKKANIFMEIVHIKSLLREFGFNWNGPACSFYDLFQSCKRYLYGETEAEENRSQQPYMQEGDTPRYETRQGTKNHSQAQKVIDLIKDLFYASKVGPIDLFNQAKIGDSVDLHGFTSLIQKYSGDKINESDILQAFNQALGSKDRITLDQFQKIFKWDLPTGPQWETSAIKALKEWIYTNCLSSETAFEVLANNVGKMLEKQLTRVDLHRAFHMVGLTFSAPEVDSLFNMLDLNQDGVIDLHEWQSRVYEDNINPLQLLRQIVNQNRVTSDDLLYKMDLRIWDEPLDWKKFVVAMRRLDPTLSEPQLRHLMKILKGKDGRVDIIAMLRNFCGKEHETIDYQNRVFREIYSVIHPHNEEKLLGLLENADPLNDGRVEPQGLKSALMKVCPSVGEEALERFIRFLDKDQSGKVQYMDFMQRMAEVSNRDHNPFKSVVQRLHYFLQQNNQSSEMLLKRLAIKRDDPNAPSQEAVSVDMFAHFLKTKIDKKRSDQELKKYAQFIDIDKDGWVSAIDLQTCMENLHNQAFFRNGGEALKTAAFASRTKFFPNQQPISNDRAAELSKQIREALIAKKVAYREAFNRFDKNKDGFLNYAEFSQGIETILKLSEPVKEKVFAFMDKSSLGMVDYPNFLDFIQITGANSISTQKTTDNFDWEEKIIEQIKQWILEHKISTEEAFKVFDHDFDGIVNKEDLKWVLINLLKIKPEQVFPTKLDRLFNLLDFYKTGQIQPSDINRLINNENPYTQDQGSRTKSAQTFRKTMGGTLYQTSTFDWKLSAIQQIGLVISKKYSDVKESFEQASEHLQKVSFEQFKKFVEENGALNGFNLTLTLMQTLFSSLDPHKKGYITETDWVNAFQAFNWNSQVFVELKNAIQCSFTDCESAFSFFLTHKQGLGTQKVIQYTDFEHAVNSLTANRFQRAELQALWKQVTDQGRASHLDRYQFRSHFDNLQYSGHSTVRQVQSAAVGMRTTIKSQTSSSATWDNDVLEKLRNIIRTSSKSFEQIFREFDEDKNGYISQMEFRNAIRKLNLGLTSREIDNLMKKIDANQDGLIDWQEFMAKFKTNDVDVHMKTRARDKIARLKEMMVLHMASANDAFRYFDESKMGKLTYQEFSKLVIRLNELADDKQPTYPIIKDLFDTIDIRKDGIIDMNEWTQTFGNVTEGDRKLTIQATPLTMWENSREFGLMGTLIAKNRKLLKEQFIKVAQGQKEIPFEVAFSVIKPLVTRQFPQAGDDKLKILVRVGDVGGAQSSGPGSLIDYEKLLEVYRKRHT